MSDAELVRDFGAPIFGLPGRDPVLVRCRSTRVDKELRQSAKAVEALFGYEHRPQTYRVVGTHRDEPQLGFDGYVIPLLLAGFDACRGRLCFPLRLDIEHWSQRLRVGGTVVDGDIWSCGPGWLLLAQSGDRWCSVTAPAGVRQDPFAVVSIDLSSLPTEPAIDPTERQSLRQTPSVDVDVSPLGFALRDDFVIGGWGHGRLGLHYGDRSRPLAVETYDSGLNLRQALRVLLLRIHRQQSGQHGIPASLVVERNETAIRVLGRKRQCWRYRCGAAWFVIIRVGDRGIYIHSDDDVDSELDLVEIDPSLLVQRKNDLQALLERHSRIVNENR